MRRTRSDLCGLTAERWGALALPVAEFLLQQRGDAPPPGVPTEGTRVMLGRVVAGGAGPELREVVAVHTVSASATLGQARDGCGCGCDGRTRARLRALTRSGPPQVLEAFTQRSVHHLWVVAGDAAVPVGVVTPTDVLRVRAWHCARCALMGADAAVAAFRCATPAHRARRAAHGVRPPTRCQSAHCPHAAERL